MLRSINLTNSNSIIEIMVIIITYYKYYSQSVMHFENI